MKFIKNWYNLLEGQGLIAHDIGPGQAHGTLTPNVSWLQYYYPPGEPYGFKGATFAASVSRIVTPAAAGFNTADGSIEMLVKPSWTYTDGINHHFWDTYGGSNRRFLLMKQSGNNTALYTDNTNRGTFSYPWAAGTLYHIVLNWGTNNLYINDVLAHTFTAAGLGLGADNLYIGDRYGNANMAFNGNIYYFIVRDVPLSLPEVKQFRQFFSPQYIAP